MSAEDALLFKRQKTTSTYRNGFRGPKDSVIAVCNERRALAVEGPGNYALKVTTDAVRLDWRANPLAEGGTELFEARVQVFDVGFVELLQEGKLGQSNLKAALRLCRLRPFCSVTNFTGAWSEDLLARKEGQLSLGLWNGCWVETVEKRRQRQIRRQVLQAGASPQYPVDGQMHGRRILTPSSPCLPCCRGDAAPT